MIKKFRTLFAILLLAIFLMPSQAYACGTKSTKTEKSCCKKEKKATTKQKDCCKKHSQNKGKSDCDGKCNHSTCSCPTFNFAFTLPFIAEMRSDNFEVSNKKQKNHHSETFISSGFTSVWLPPKIK